MFDLIEGPKVGSWSGHMVFKRKLLILLELNEVNFEAVEYYIAKGKLPTFGRLFEKHGFVRTTSESHYEELEPWIQWVTAHTGKSLAEHGIFRLGDIVHHDIPQIWEELESQGLRVGAISPMNAKNRTKNAAFFVPDPWTDTEVTGSLLLQKMYTSIAQAVNDNAQGRLTVASAAWLLAGALSYARPANYGEYLRLVASTRKRTWRKAMFLDLLLADTFIGLSKRKAPHFATLFLNAGAHIQHHYMFNSPVYANVGKNPDWYVAQGEDPLLDVYSLYDRIISHVQASFPSARLMLATGLHQEPHPKATFYWRLRNHCAYLKKIGVPFQRVEPRMSRDFLVVCETTEQALYAADILSSARSVEGVPLFEVDNRGNELFVMLTYPNDIPEGFEYVVGNLSYINLRDDVAFVAIKNGQHNGAGYYLDTGLTRDSGEADFKLCNLPTRIRSAIAA